MAKIEHLNLKTVSGTSLAGERLYVAYSNGILAIDPFPASASQLDIRRMECGWQPVFLEIDFGSVLRLIHRVPRHTGRRKPLSAQRLIAAMSVLMRYAPERIPDKVTSLKNLDLHFGRAYDLFAFGTIESIRHFRFPPPPVAVDDPDVFEPLARPDDLIAESIMQDNCCASASYCEQILSGQVYLYRTIGKWGLERATFEVVPDWAPDERDKIWVLGHVEAECGRAAHPRTLKAIRDFLKRVQGLVQQDLEGLGQPANPSRATGPLRSRSQ